MKIHADKAVKALCKRDRRMAVLIEQVGPYTLRTNRGTTFQGLLKSIVYQQLSGKAARSIHKRIIRLLPKRPSEHAQAVHVLTEQKLQTAGISRAKVTYVKDLAAKTLDGSLPTRVQMRSMDDEQIVTELTKVRGVGRWTAEMLLIFWLGRSDVLPATDLGIRKGFSLIFETGELPSPDDVLQHGERWRPFRTVAAWYLWRAGDQLEKNGDEPIW